MKEFEGLVQGDSIKFKYEHLLEYTTFVQSDEIGFYVEVPVFGTERKKKLYLTDITEYEVIPWSA